VKGQGRRMSFVIPLKLQLKCLSGGFGFVGTAQVLLSAISNSKYIGKFKVDMRWHFLVLIIITSISHICSLNKKINFKDFKIYYNISIGN